MENYDENKEINKRISRKNKNLLTLTRVKSPLNTKSKAEILFFFRGLGKNLRTQCPGCQKEACGRGLGATFSFGCLFEVTNLPIEVLIAAFENLKAT